MKNKKYGPSYVKVAGLIALTSEFKEFKNKTLANLNSIEFARWEYNLDYWGTPQSNAIFVVRETGSEFKARQDGNRYEHVVEIYTHYICDKWDLQKVVTNTLGVIPEGKRKPIVPKHNCNISDVIEFMWEEIRGHLKMEDLIISKQQEIRLSLRSHHDESYENGFKEKREEHQVKEIMKIIEKMPDVTPKLVQRALDEYLMQIIVEQ